MTANWSSADPPPGYPFAPTDQSTVARLYGVDPLQVQRWLDAGLPAERDGSLDPMVVCNWVSWHDLPSAPQLERRWHRFSRHFERAAQVNGSRTITWHRHHRLYVPQRDWECVRWWLPNPSTQPWQTVEGVTWAEIPAPAHAYHDGVLFDMPQAASVVSARGQAVVSTQSLHAQVDHQTLAQLSGLLEPVVDQFNYAYRRHAHADRSGTNPGTCLDVALACAAVLTDNGWQVALHGGIIAVDEIANPHYWLTISRDGQEVIPLDPTMATVARMLKQPWRDVLRNWIGVLDPWRVTLGHSCHPLHAHDWPLFVHAVPGEVTAVDLQGHAWDLWSCQDWVLGSTTASFEEQ